MPLIIDDDIAIIFASQYATLFAIDAAAAILLTLHYADATP